MGAIPWRFKSSFAHQDGTHRVPLSYHLKQNDCMADNPHVQQIALHISPADRTGYLCFSAQLYNKNGAVHLTNVSISEFLTSGTQGTGIVLESGQTESATIYVGLQTKQISIGLTLA